MVLGSSKFFLAVSLRRALNIPLRWRHPGRKKEPDNIGYRKEWNRCLACIQDVPFQRRNNALAATAAVFENTSAVARTTAGVCAKMCRRTTKSTTEGQGPGSNLATDGCRWTTYMLALLNTTAGAGYQWRPRHRRRHEWATAVEAAAESGEDARLIVRESEWKR